jgi:glycosyltransferase involved in cell wall biosynthesis
MKILYATRLFSGLENSCTTGVWSPSGVPTIYKIIEEIDKNYTPRFLFTVKDSGSGYCSIWKDSNDQEIVISGLKHSVHVISGINFFPKWLGRKVRIFLRDIRQSLFIIIEIIKFKPDLIYCDHANVIIGGLLARIQNRIPVIFRVMGVDDFMRKCLTPKNLIQGIYKWSYKSPFAMVICTQDGSGVELWLKKGLKRGVTYEVLLNGVDVVNLCAVKDKNLFRIPDNKVVILFIGKLEKYKGCYEFVESILLMLEKKHQNIHAIMVGTGGEEICLRNTVKKEHATKYFTFIDRLKHEQIFEAHSICDIYVSLNHFGNLSNANLEAIQSNDCMIIASPQYKLGIDVITEKILGDSVIKVPINNSNELADRLIELIYSEEKRNLMSQYIMKRKKDFLYSWDERINYEIRLFKNILKDK